MKVKPVLATTFFLLIAMIIQADHGTNLSADLSHWAKHPVIHQLANGHIIALWAEGEKERIAEIQYRILDTGTMVWGPKLKSVGRIYATHFPQVVEDHEGVLHMAFMDGNAGPNRDIWYASYDYRKSFGEQWSQKERVDLTREQSAWSRISIDPVTEDLYVTYQHVYNYAANENWHSNIVAYRKAKEPVTGLYGEWMGPEKMSRKIEDKDIHQATAFADGQLHGVYEEGTECAWRMTYNWLYGGDGFNQGVEETVSVLPGSAIPSYWPELEADSKGNLYCVWSQRSMETKGAFKPLGEPWREIGTLINGSVITMIGLKVARNDVAYVVHNQGYKMDGNSGQRPVFVRFTDTHISSPVVVRDTGRGQRVLEIEVDQDGAAHVVWAGPYDPKNQENMSIYYERAPQEGGPEVEISAPGVVLTHEEVNFQGTVLTSATPIQKHRFYCHKLKAWGGDDMANTYTLRFPEEGLYTVHYYAADSQNLMGHASITVEVVDAPFQPTKATRSMDIVRGLLFRAWINTIQWKSDERNKGKFNNLSHFNIYRRESGSTDWGETIIEIACMDHAETYEYRSPRGFLTREDAMAVEYAVTIVAIVNGQEKESRKTVVSGASVAGFDINH